jgi:hypothetical protein
MDDPEFLAQMAKEVESTIRKLEGREAEMMELLGAERVEELRQLWAKEMDAGDERDLKTNMDWDDKEMIWVWSRLERARAKRVLVGRQTMITVQLGTGEKKEKRENSDGTDNGM